MIMRYTLSILCLVALGMGCSKEAENNTSPERNNSNPSYKKLRTEVIQQIVSQTDARFTAFEKKLDVLESAIGAWQTSSTEADLTASQVAFVDAILSWQEIEASLHSPTDADTMWTTTRDDVYSWPLANRCRVDQELVRKTYESDADFTALLVNAKGLDALEYLLWHSEENDCPPQSTINSEGEWDMISDLDNRRSAYSLASVKLVRTNALALKKSAATLGGSLIEANTSEALNTLSNTLYYLDTNVKDIKIAHPLGLQDCAEASCFDDVELPLSAASLSAINRNLLAFDQMFFGEPGFDDLLEASDAKDIAADIRVSLDKALQLSAEPGTLEDLADAEKATLLFDEIKAITDRLKTDFIGVLDLELPQRAEGDND